MIHKIKNFMGHFKTITMHKLLVMKYCFNVGLYKQGILHDLSKYTWIEFSAGIKYYRGNVSPNGIQKMEEGFSTAWLHHKGRNKHHFEYWIDYGVREEEGLQGMEIPIRYVIEMFIDRMCASKNYLKEKYKESSPLEYYNARKKYYIMHKSSRELLEFLLNKLAVEGEKCTLEYIRKTLKMR